MEFVTYKKFYQQEQLNGIAEILTESGIEFIVTEDRESLDSLYGDKQFKQQYFIKLKKQDFDKADDILLERSGRVLDTVDKDHYLFTFTNEELFEIIVKPDEWNELDYLLALKILKERGQSVDIEKIKELKKERIKELAKPDEKNRGWIYAGYVFSFLGGLLGIFIGWHLSTFKKTLPNGERVYGYTTRDRTHGNRILFIGIVMLIFWLMARILLPEE
jgi:hypothetical protein